MLEDGYDVSPARTKAGPHRYEKVQTFNFQRFNVQNLRLDGRLDYVFLLTFHLLLDDSWTRVLRI